jgi:hypothetical protein
MFQPQLRRIISRKERRKDEEGGSRSREPALAPQRKSKRGHV